MTHRSAAVQGCAFIIAATLTTPAQADPFFFSTGNPDGKIATLVRIPSTGKLETETADDFVTTLPTMITGASFIGLIPTGVPIASITNVEIELYHVFPLESAIPPSGNVATRVNSPSDNNFAAADGKLGTLTFSTKLLSASFPALNSVINGINAAPNQFTGGEGAVTGQEVEVDVNFTAPIALGPDHVFFRPEVDLGATGNFLWLSASKPIVAPGTPFSSDLQSWIRNDGPGTLAPDWERIGTDVTHQGPFNAAFTLTGTTVPEPASLGLLAAAMAALGLVRRSR